MGPPRSSAKKLTLSPERDEDSGLVKGRVFEIYLEEDHREMEAKLEFRFGCWRTVWMLWVGKWLK